MTRGIVPRVDGMPGGCANRVRGIGIGKGYALRCQPIHIWCFNPIPKSCPPHVFGIVLIVEYDYEVGALRRFVLTG